MTTIDNPELVTRSDTVRKIRPLTVFIVLWGCQALIHQDFFQDWLDRPFSFGWVVTVFAVIAILRPRVSSLTLLAITSLIYNIERWPEVPNHILVEGVFNFTILVAIGWATLEARRRGEIEPDGDHIMDRFAPILIFGTVVMYWFAALAKLNEGFFDPVASCGVDLYADLRSRFFFLPSGEWTADWVIWATILVEVAIPLAFSFRRTRVLGLAIGVPFHLILGLIGYRTFSAFAYAVYFLFCREQITAGVQMLLARRPAWLLHYRRPLQVGFAATVFVYFLLSGLGFDTSGVGPFQVLHVGWLAWVAYSLLVGALYAWSLLVAPRMSTTAEVPVAVRSDRVRPGLLWIIGALVILNGSAQYLGVKTQTSFTMYSNLRTEDGDWNHLIVPSFTEFGDATDDLVRVEATDQPELVELMEDEMDLTWFEFRRILNEAERPFTVTYTRDGATSTLRVDASTSLSQAGIERPNPILSRLVLFRPVPQAGPVPCLH